MATNDNSGQEGIDLLSDREFRSLTECMVVFGGDGGIFSVVNFDGTAVYAVDTIDGRCTCPDARYNLDANEKCKYQHRVEFVRGRRELPAWINSGAIDDNLGALTDVRLFAANTEAER